MNSTSLRRLAADHASLYTYELPPYYLFPSSSSSETLEDLTQLIILVTGPQGTPYSQGLWKLILKIPEDYPKSPPRGSFRTRMWHPNVEENSGNICVDTLKKDWHSKLTLRDVLITISCLLIQPNPDSALNATAGHLLQEDYDSFARKAQLMTSIHASIPSHMKAKASEARARGSDVDSRLPGGQEHKPKFRGNSDVSSRMIMNKSLQHIVSRRSASAPEPLAHAQDEVDSEERHEKMAMKENDLKITCSPVATQVPRKPSLVERSLSDLPIPLEPAKEEAISSSSFFPTRSLDANELPLQENAASEQTSKNARSTKADMEEVFDGRRLKDRDANGPAMVSQQEVNLEDTSRPAKRVCSDEAKENMSKSSHSEMLSGKPPIAIPKPPIANVRIASAPVSSGSRILNGKARIGLRRL